MRQLQKELKLEREEYRARGDNKSERIRTPTPPRERDNAYQRGRKDYDNKKANGGVRAYFSSRELGSGVNMPETYMTSGRLADQALLKNMSEIGVPVEAPDFQEIMRIK